MPPPPQGGKLAARGVGCLEHALRQGRGRLRHPLPRCDRPTEARRAAPPVAEDGDGRPAGWRHRARLQQHAVRDHGEHRPPRGDAPRGVRRDGRGVAGHARCGGTRRGDGATIDEFLARQRTRPPSDRYRRLGRAGRGDAAPDAAGEYRGRGQSRPRAPVSHG